MLESTRILAHSVLLGVDDLEHELALVGSSNKTQRRGHHNSSYGHEGPSHWTVADRRRQDRKPMRFRNDTHQGNEKVQERFDRFVKQSDLQPDAIQLEHSFIGNLSYLDLDASCAAPGSSWEVLMRDNVTVYRSDFLTDLTPKAERRMNQLANHLSCHRSCVHGPLSIQEDSSKSMADVQGPNIDTFRPIPVRKLEVRSSSNALVCETRLERTSLGSARTTSDQSSLLSIPGSECPFPQCHRNLAATSQLATTDLKKCIHIQCDFITDSHHSWLAHISQAHHSIFSVMALNLFCESSTTILCGEKDPRQESFGEQTTHCPSTYCRHCGSREMDSCDCGAVEPCTNCGECG